MLQSNSVSSAMASSQNHITSLQNNMRLPNNQVPIISQGLQYVRLWEGNLMGQCQGKHMSICHLEAYRQDSSPSLETRLVADWPNQMQICRLIHQEHMHNEDYQRKAETLVFRPVGKQWKQGFLGQLAVKELCAVIELPSQTLLLASMDVKKPKRMVGMLFPGDMVVFESPFSTNPNPQQEQEQLQEVLQQQQQLQQEHPQQRQQQHPQQIQQHPQ